jgi:hypothetical protein
VRERREGAWAGATAAAAVREPPPAVTWRKLASRSRRASRERRSRR